MKKTNVLCIMDGFGHNKNDYGNAVAAAKKPNIDMLMSKYPYTYIGASGLSVGLPDGQMGNSEVGHTNMGAGRVVYQELTRITKAIEDGEFFENEALVSAVKKSVESGNALHIMGLLSDGGVHSHISHIFALVELAKKLGQNKVYLHCIMDGRDVPPTSGKDYVAEAQAKMNEIGVGKVATVVGRYYAMDRDNNYDRLIKSYDVIVNNKGEINESPKKYIEQSYEKEVIDEFFLPAKFVENGNVEESDGIIAFNFRKDRLRELMTAITNPTAVEMETVHFNNVKTLTMMPVVESVKAPHAFSDPVLTNILGEYIEKQNLSQLRIAETEKYAHVTFFFDGGKEVDYKNEKKILIPSPKVATYDLKPEMSANEVTEKLLEELGETDLVILNFANGDMVGHTGVLEAAIKAVETVDKNLKLIYDKVIELDGTLIVTADHGNCEEMLDDNDNIVTSHTTNPVPFIITRNDIKLYEGKLGDIAPTILDLMNIEKPEEMTGISLIEK